MNEMYRWVDHTAELELHIEADSEDGVFSDALRALGEVLGGDDTGGQELSRDVAVEAPDRAALLAAWMDELVYLAETDGLVPQEAAALRLEDGGLAAQVRGHRGAPAHLVKGVTYHRLAFESEGGRYRATVVLDV